MRRGAGGLLVALDDAVIEVAAALLWSPCRQPAFAAALTAQGLVNQRPSCVKLVSANSPATTLMERPAASVYD